MGKDCHRLDDHGGGGGGASSSSKSNSKKANGCMAAFYQLFDFQHFYFPSHHHHHHLTIDSPSRSKGLKLEVESQTSTTYKEKQSMNIPVNMRVRTSSRLTALATDTPNSSSEICNSPGSSSNTPNLVARLMGLDLLPDKTDLNHSLTNLHTMTHNGSNRLTSHTLSDKGTRLGIRSLPESPRISSARKSDFDIHRLSLQLNKENKHEGFGCSRLKETKQDQEETPSPRYYARQVVKQVKERVVPRRVVCMDITNSVKNREAGPLQKSNELRRDSKVSCSSRTRFSDKENPTSTVHKTNPSLLFRPEPITRKPKPTRVPHVSVSEASGEKQSQKRVKQRQLRPINQRKMAESETRRSIKPSATPDIRIKQREAFFSEPTDAKANRFSNPVHKKIPRSNDLDNISAREPSQKQINERNRLKSDDVATVSAPSEGFGIDSEQHFVARIMNLAGINTESPVSSASLFSPSIIFQKLDHLGENPSGSLDSRCNTGMLFETAELPAKRRRNYHRSQLIGELCSAVARYRRKHCPVPEETASMVEEHSIKTKKLEEEEEGEEIVAEIERDIVDALVRETASELSLNSSGIIQRRRLTKGETLR